MDWRKRCEDVTRKSGGTCPLCRTIYEESDILLSETIMKKLGRDSKIEEASKPIQVFVHLVDGKTRTINTNAKHTLLEFARNLESITGIPVD